MSFLLTVKASISSLASNIFLNPVNLGLVTICGILIYKIIQTRRKPPTPPKEPELPSLKKHDMTVEELRTYNGKGENGRICVAVNGRVFDVTKGGKRFYGPDGPYSVFAGRDASRGLATFSVDETSLKGGFDDLSDLSSSEMESIKEWEMQFREKYIEVGKLLSPGEHPSEYEYDEDEGTPSNSTQSAASSATAKKDK